MIWYDELYTFKIFLNNKQNLPKYVAGQYMEYGAKTISRIK